MAFEKINATDTLNTGREKINKYAIEPAMRAEDNSMKALDKAMLAVNKSNDVQTQLNNVIIESGTSDAEVLQSRGSYEVLNDRLNAADATGINVLGLGLKNDGVTDNYATLKNLLGTLANDAKLFFPAGEYKFSDNITIDRLVHFEGIKPVYASGNFINGTVFSGGGIYLKRNASGSFFKNIGVVNKSKPNGFDLRDGCSDITIDNCLTIARDHGFLIESYTGKVSNIIVSNCQAFDGIHGFITKATNVTFLNCLSTNIPFWGFGVISDNIQGANKVGAAINNTLLNCKALNCGTAFCQYKRDYFGDGSAYDCASNQFIGCSSKGCSVPLQLGDVVGDTGGGKYTSYPVKKTTITNFTESESANNVRIYQTENLTMTAVSVSKDIILRRDANNSNATLTGINGGKSGQLQDLTPLEKSSVPSLAFGRYFRSDNVTLTTITDFKNGVDGKIYEIMLWDENTVIKSTSKIFLLGANVSGKGSSIKLKFQDGIYFEISRSMPATRSAGFNYRDATDINISNYEFVDLFGKGSESNLVKINAPGKSPAVITILIRSTDGNFSFGGFDPSQFVVPENLPTSVQFGTGLMTQWAWMKEINKYVLISKNDTKYI